MEQLVELLVEWGPMGMFVAAFLAGSFFPFSSEVVMLTLLAAGASPAGLLGWVPLLGSVITVALGFLRVNVVAAISTIAIGKFVRYLVLVEAWRLAL